MSRTDKDRPLWVRNRDPLEEGYREYHIHHSRRWGIHDRDGICDLEAAKAFRGDTYRQRHELGYHFNCGTEVGGWTFRYYTTSSPDPRWERYVHYGPHRRTARETLNNLAREYNAGSDIDEDAVARRGVDIRGRLPYWD